MKDTEYWRKYYKMSVKETNVVLSVKKSSDTDWCSIESCCNGNANEIRRITLKSKEMSEQLYFMLGQMLDKS